MKRNLILLLVYLLNITLFAQSKEVQKLNFLLDWKANTNHLGVYVAQEESYYKEQNLDLKIINPSQTTTTVLVGSSRADFGVAYANDIIYARNEGIPIVIIAAVIADESSCFVWRQSSGIRTIKDLVGKRYGSWGSPEEAATLKYVVEKNHLDFNKIKIFNTGESDFLTATLKNVDFTWEYKGWGILSAQLQNIPLGTYCPYEHFKELNKASPLIITNEKMIKEHPDIVRAFLKATAKGYNFAIKNPKKAAEDLERAVPELDKKLINASSKLLATLYQGKASYWGYLNSEQFKTYSNWMKEVKLIQKVPDVSSYVNDSFLKP